MANVGHTLNKMTKPIKQVDDDWRPVTLATIKDLNQVVAALTEAINGKHTPLKNKAIYLRIKPHSVIAVVRFTMELSEVREDGWDVDMDVVNSIENVLVQPDPMVFRVDELECPIAFVSFNKVTVDDTDTNPASGFWFQLKDLEWKLV